MAWYVTRPHTHKHGATHAAGTRLGAVSQKAERKRTGGRNSRGPSHGGYGEGRATFGRLPPGPCGFCLFVAVCVPPRKISPDTWAVCLSFGNCCNNQTLTGWGRPGTLLASCIDNLDNTKDHDKTAPRGILSGMVFQVLGSWSFRVMRHRKSAQPISLSPGLFPVGLS